MLKIESALAPRCSEETTTNKDCKQTDFLLNLVARADGDSGDRDRAWIVAEQDHERSTTGEKIRVHQSLAQAAEPSAWLGENTQRSRSSRSDQSGVARAQQHAHLPGCDQARQQTQFNHWRFCRLPGCASSKSHSRHSNYATMILVLAKLVLVVAVDFLAALQSEEPGRGEMIDQSPQPAGSNPKFV